MAKPESVKLTKNGVTRAFDSPSAVVKARHDGWVPAGVKPSEPGSKPDSSAGDKK